MIIILFTDKVKSLIPVGKEKMVKEQYRETDS
jgi:hypothetical protein